jgi:hypothetical protein
LTCNGGQSAIFAGFENVRELTTADASGRRQCQRQDANRPPAAKIAGPPRQRGKPPPPLCIDFLGSGRSRAIFRPNGCRSAPSIPFNGTLNGERVQAAIPRPFQFTSAIALM